MSFFPPDTPYHLDHKIEQNICYFCFIVTKQFIKQFVSQQGYTEWTNQHPELLSIYKRKKMSIAVILGWSASLITEEERWSKKASNVDCTNILLHINNRENISVHEKHVKYALKHTGYIMNALQCNATRPQAWKKNMS